MSAPTLPKYIDGLFTTPRRISRTPYRYPFWRLGDVTTKDYDAVYVVQIDSFTPTAKGTEDPENTGHYLIAESQPEIFQGDLAMFRRTYSKIPTTQTEEATIMVTRPIPGLSAYPGVFGSYRVFQPDTTLQQFDAYLAALVSSDSGATALYPTGGTYTLSFAGDTTGALNYNASSGDLQTALNALTSISNRGGVTVAGTYNSTGGFTVSFNSYAAATVDVSSLTATPFATKQILPSFSGYMQLISLRDGSVSGGTFTITMFGQTTAAIAFSANETTWIANISAALNALSEITNRGGCTVTYYESVKDGYGNFERFVFNISFTNPAITGTSSLTPTPSQIAVTSSVITQVVRPQASSQRYLYAPGHGISAGDTLYLKAGTTYYPAIAGAFTVIDTNNLALTIDSTLSYAAVSAISEVGRRTKTGYKPGTAPTLCNLVTRFSLSAITPDAYQGDDATFLQAIFSGSTAINYRVGDSFRWPSAESPIRALTTTQLSSANL